MGEVIYVIFVQLNLDFFHVNDDKFDLIILYKGNLEHHCYQKYCLVFRGHYQDYHLFDQYLFGYYDLWFLLRVGHGFSSPQL